MKDFSKLFESDSLNQQQKLREMQAQHEKEAAGLAQLLKQAEKEIETRNIEINHYKQMCAELAE